MAIKRNIAPVKDSVSPKKLESLNRDFKLAQVERPRPIKSLVSPKMVLDLLTTEQIFDYLKYVRRIEVVDKNATEKRPIDSRGGS